MKRDLQHCSRVEVKIQALFKKLLILCDYVASKVLNDSNNINNSMWHICLGPKFAPENCVLVFLSLVSHVCKWMSVSEARRVSCKYSNLILSIMSYRKLSEGEQSLSICRNLYLHLSLLQAIDTPVKSSYHHDVYWSGTFHLHAQSWTDKPVFSDRPHLFGDTGYCIHSNNVFIQLVVHWVWARHGVDTY